MIVSLYAGGMTIRDIQAHLERTLGTELGHETIANITDYRGCEIGPTSWRSEYERVGLQADVITST